MAALIPTEHQEQCALIDWWRLAHRGYGLPEFALFAVPNGGARHKATAGKLKAEGVRSGISDLVLLAARGPYHGALVEMKRTKRSRTSDAQRDFAEYAASAGYAHYTAKGFDEARSWLVSYIDFNLMVVRG